MIQIKEDNLDEAYSISFPSSCASWHGMVEIFKQVRQGAVSAPLNVFGEIREIESKASENIFKIKADSFNDSPYSKQKKGSKREIEALLTNRDNFNTEQAVHSINAIFSNNLNIAYVTEK